MTGTGTGALSLVHLVQEPRLVVAGTRPPLLLLLHGVGSNEHDLFSLAPALDPRFLIVSARAPYQVENGGNGWFHIRFTAQGPVINPDEAEESRRTLRRFLDELTERYGVDPHRRFLLGFSQGAIMSLCVMLTAPEALAGVVAMSGRLLPEIRPKAVPAERLRAFPVLVQHGLYDQLLPISYGRDIRDYLAATPAALTYREYPIGHQVTEQSLEEARAWLADHLDTAG